MAGNDFKLVAIRPLNNCSKKYSKILKNGRIYQFYNDFDFSAYDKSGLVKCGNSVPDIYSLNNGNGPSVSISAVVGRNGSGKSTLFELYYQFCFFVSMKLGLVDLNLYANVQLGLHEKLVNVQECFDEMNGALLVEVFFKRGNYLIWFKLDEFGKILYHKQVIKKGEAYFKDLSEKVVSSKNDFVEPNNEDQFCSLFYNIAVNYSLYGLNTRENGMWLLPLFHKNDGYQTPMVLNPYRKEGVIDINSETLFAKYRLLANVLFSSRNLTESQEYTPLTGRLNVTKVILKVNLEKFAYIARVMTGLEDAKKNVAQATDGKNVDLYQDKKEKAQKLIEKTAEIFDLALLYERYKVKALQEKLTKNMDLNNDMDLPNIHVFFKLKQIRNFLRLSKITEAHLSELRDALYSSPCHGTKEIEYSLHDVVNLFGIQNDDSLIDVYCKLPPPIFDFDLELVPLKGEKKIHENIRFMHLSSGERHMIYAIQTIVYHIVNLESIHKEAKRDFLAKKHFVYDCLNVMLDEIELYFHPEYQRRFVTELLAALDKIDYCSGIKGINVVINTHSPFILSDIPKQNCLFLDNENGIAIPRNSQEMHTYGANIYDMLHNSFFLNNSMGEFSEKSIKSIMKRLNTKGKMSEKAKKAIELEIKMIDEPVIRRKLAQMYDDRFKSSSDLRLQMIEESIRCLEQEKNQLLRNL